ncbi:MOSC domain-containing protein [Chryseosolibacter indicus]|uniref:MOSC domain-containing protein n=1 Tax=Chryseosolibacter indicus TaxID=2782351 RepID=A0ABS5VKV6_9BACT|nr:MOSC N-terminal beta barrel domain-containing protein [Chryseosolibacter indicus]MBT1702078.1 MOSC domain-containing protein [Chryseosolibacter indicus]
MKALTLSEIWIYPIKSLGGIKLNSAKVLEKGLALDRRWMLVDEYGTFLTQRVYSTMAFFKLSLDHDRITITYKNPHQSTESPSLIIDTNAPALGEVLKAKIWDDDIEVVEVDTKISEWFSSLLNFKCKLVNFPENKPRAVDARYKVNEENVSLADAYPFLIIGQASLDYLNDKLAEPLPMNRFRPNFVFDGGEPYEEDNWRHFSIGKNRFVAVKPCARCVLTTVNQDTAVKGPEPLATLAKYRKRDNKIYFGQNLVALDQGIVNVGDTIILN